MTRQQVEQYPYLVAKAKRLQGEIQALRGDWSICGAVMASQHSPPYAVRQVLVGADAYDTTDEVQKKIEKKHVELVTAQAQVREIEQYIESIPDLRIREIATRRVVYGEQWAEVAMAFGYKETENSVKQAYSRFFR